MMKHLLVIIAVAIVIFCAAPIKAEGEKMTDITTAAQTSESTTSAPATIKTIQATTEPKKTVEEKNTAPAPPQPPFKYCWSMWSQKGKKDRTCVHRASEEEIELRRCIDHLEKEGEMEICLNDSGDEGAQLVCCCKGNDCHPGMDAKDAMGLCLKGTMPTSRVLPCPSHSCFTFTASDQPMSVVVGCFDSRLWFGADKMKPEQTVTHEGVRGLLRLCNATKEEPCNQQENNATMLDDTPTMAAAAATGEKQKEEGGMDMTTVVIAMAAAGGAVIVLLCVVIAVLVCKCRRVLCFAVESSSAAADPSPAPSAPAPSSAEPAATTPQNQSAESTDLASRLPEMPEMAKTEDLYEDVTLKHDVDIDLTNIPVAPSQEPPADVTQESAPAGTPVKSAYIS